MNIFPTILNAIYKKDIVLLGQEADTEAPIIKDNVIINPYSIIISKVVIGENSIIGAGSIVTKDVPSNSVYYNRVIPIIKLRNDKIKGNYFN